MIKEEKFLKKEKISTRKEIDYIIKNGRRYKNKYFKIYINSNNKNFSRIKISVSKQIGLAVKRNKTKRILHEIYRKNKRLFGNGLDWLIIPNKDIHLLTYWKVEKVLLDEVNQRSKKKN